MATISLMQGKALIEYEVNQDQAWVTPVHL